MKCPHCGRDIADKLVMSHAARIAGKRSHHEQIKVKEIGQMEEEEVIVQEEKKEKRNRRWIKITAAAAAAVVTAIVVILRR